MSANGMGRRDRKGREKSQDESRAIGFPGYGIMDDEYRLAWANIEGWTTNAKRIAPQIKC